MTYTYTIAGKVHVTKPVDKGEKPARPPSTPGKAGLHTFHGSTIRNISQGCHVKKGNIHVVDFQLTFIPCEVCRGTTLPLYE